MNTMMRHRVFRGCLGLLVGVSTLGACSALDVQDPNAIHGEDLNNATGAGYLLTVARWRLAQATNRSILHIGLLTDELVADIGPNEGNDELLLDVRETTPYLPGGSNSASTYGALQILRKDATVAIPRVRAYGERTHVGELFALRGFAALQLAENVCPGFPLRELDGMKPVFGPPLTTAQAMEAALTEFDSALVYADSARTRNFASIGRARALLGLKRYAEAAAAVATVPTNFSESIIPDANRLFLNQTQYIFPWISVGDRQGTNGLDFISAQDPRVAITPTVPAEHHPSFTKYTINKYNALNSPIVIASGIEARLIEAEAQLQPATSPAGPWLATLNALRATVSLPDTTDPGTASGRVDLLFRERAFWLFATGRRLGDLHRLISHYGRSVDTVFPVGSAWEGATFGTATYIPFNPNVEMTWNPAIVGCTSL